MRNKLGRRIEWLWGAIALALICVAACSSGGGSNESVGSAAMAIITGTGPCRVLSLTSSATPSTINNASEPTFSPSIDALFPAELQVLSGDPSDFTATLLTTTEVSSTTTVERSCTYNAASNPSRFVRASCTNTTPTTFVNFTNLTFNLARIAPGIGSVQAQADVTAINDNNPCTADLCDPGTGVSHPNLVAGSACPQDGNLCNGIEACNGAGACISPGNEPAGTSCSDGNACNGVETCNGSGTCTPGTPLANGTSCSDGNACNGEERCQAGACMAGTPLTAADYDDHNPCTADSCDPAQGGILNTPIPSCQTSAGAPPLDLTASPGFGASTEFLYTGTSPVQTGVASGTIDPERSTVIRGRVLGTSGTTPASGVTVTIVGHPEYGQTLTRSDGFYDLAVNGGGTFTVQMSAAGALVVQRTAVTKVHEWKIVDDVVLTAPYTSADTFAPGNPSPAQVVRGATTLVGEDGDPERRATIYFPPNTEFTNFTPPPGPLAIQVTEYTRANGQLRMPGELPPTSGYTYAVEVSVPAATAVGINDVEFNQPVVLYVSNFTGSPAGETVPLGYYDRTKGAWLGEPSGRILKIASVTGGLANVDINNDGVDDSASLGIDTPERTFLAAEYSVGTTLWRSAVEHFSPWDCNWGFGPPLGAVAPPPPNPQDDTPEDSCERAGSIIGCESRTLGEELPIVGTPFKLRYQSDRMPGFRHRVQFRLTDGTSLPASLLRAHVQLEVAGRRFDYVRQAPLTANDLISWTWDGVDAYGREVPAGTYRAKVRVGFEYEGTTTNATANFGERGETVITGNRNARTITLWNEATISLSHDSTRSLGFGGWTLDANHILDNGTDPTIYQGYGIRRKLGSTTEYINSVIDTVVGGGSFGSPTENVPATEAFVVANGMTQVADGTLYVRDGHGTESRFYRVDANGILSTLAGLPPQVTLVAGPALHAQVRPENGFAVAPDGTVVFAQTPPGQGQGRQVWKIVPGPVPTLQHVAGNGSASPNGRECPPPVSCGDGGDATAAYLNDIKDVEIAQDGTIFIADRGSNHAIRRVGPEGKISTYYKLPAGASGGAWPWDLALREDGVLFVRSEDQRLLRIEPTGRAPTVVTASVTQWCAPDAINAFGDKFITLPGDSFVLSCSKSVVHRSANGKITRLAGSPSTPGNLGDGGPALRALFGAGLGGASMGNNHEIYVADNVNHRVRKIRPPIGSSGFGGTVVVPSDDGSEVFEFDPDGKHLRTLSSLKGTPTHAFGYHPTTNQLITITDVAGNTTTIARAPGTVTITAPRGQQTLLTLDSNGYLASVRNPVTTEITTLTHSSTGLLTDFIDPRGFAHHFEYAPDGRLLKDTDATPSSLGTRLVTSSDTTGWSVDILSPEGRSMRHRVDRAGTFGDTAIVERRTITGADGLASVIDKLIDGSRNSTRPDGTKVTVLSSAADPRWGVAATFDSEVRIDVGYPTMTHRTTRTETRTATLATAGDPFSVTAQTITTTLKGTSLADAITTRVFSAGPPAKWLTTTAAGRQIEETLDNLERVTQVTVLGSSPVTLTPLQLHYDGHGRVDQVTWGSRVYGVAYNPTTGWVDSTTAPENLGVTFNSRDNNGRPTLVTLPGGAQLATSYDLSGSVLAITPPATPAHAFSFDPNSRLASYEPPDLLPSLTPKDTLYTYDHDGLATLLNHPQKPVSFSYDALGRARIVTDVVTKTLGYDARGRLQTVATSDGILLTNTWDGSLLSQQAISGPFSHALNKTYDSFLRVSSWNLDGTGSLSVTRDGDGFITNTGGMTVTRSPNYLLTGTSVGSVSDTFGYNTFGEVTTHSVSGSATSYSATYTRDTAGRITLKSETLGGVTHSERYEYDTAGRLWEVYENGSPTPTRVYTTAPTATATAEPTTIKTA